MEETFELLKGKRIDVHCGPSSIFRGVLEGFENGVLRLNDEDDKTFFISAGKVIAVSEVTDPSVKLGFIGR